MDWSRDIGIAGGGAEVYDKLENESGINFIITDCNIPNMSGLEFVSRVQGGEFKNLPILPVACEALKWI